MGGIAAEIDAWITAISSNASIVANGQLPVKVRQPSDSTNGGTTNGFGYRFPDTTIGLNADGPTYPTLLVFGAENSIIMEVGDEFEDDTQNSGFGGLGSTPGHYSSASIAGDIGFNREAIVAYDTVDEQEFIAVGFKLGSGSSDSGGFMAFKDTDGHWCFTVNQYGFAYDDYQGYWIGNIGPYDTDPEPLIPGSTYFPLTVQATAFTGASNRSGYNGVIQANWYPKNTAVYFGRGSAERLGDFVRVDSDTEAVVGIGYLSGAVRVTI